MRLIQHITNLFSGRQHKKQYREQSNIDNSQNRALVWLGKDKLERQYFYEGWACLESWHVYDQGLPLILERDPDDPELDSDTDFIGQRKELWEHIERCVQRKVSPFLLNPAEEPKDWRAEPVELYRWAIAARIAVPDELDALLAFISSTIKPSQLADEHLADNSNLQNEQSTKYIAREQVLSAMLALTLQQLYQSNNPDISVLRQEIIDSIYSKSQVLFNLEEPPLSRPALHDLLDRSLETAGFIRA